MGADAVDFVSGVEFQFAGAKYTATQISVSRSAAEIDCTSTDMQPNDPRRYRAGEAENIDIKVDWIGATIPPVTATANLVLTGFPGAAGTKALCTGLSMTASAGDLIKGSATFKVSFD